MSDEILAELRPSMPRRVIGTGMFVGLGVVLLWLAANIEAPVQWALFLIAVAGGALWAGSALWTATAQGLVLTETELRSTDGEVLAKVSNIASVDRGAFSFKPSNGFLVRLHQSAPRRWRPGLWWRAGRRIGVGGVTPGSRGKFMADTLAVLLQERGR